MAIRRAGEGAAAQARGPMPRIPELDALRGCAAIGIVLFHYSYPGPWYDRGLYAGKISLELFFVLSGFLITSIILRYRGGPRFLFRFYARRGLRIYPIYYLALAAVVVAGLLRPGLFRLEGWLYYLFYLQNVPLYWGASRHDFAYPFHLTWSLAIEEQFYLLWPIVALAAGRRRLPWLAVGLVAVATGARAWGLSDRLLLARCDGFALGGLLAVLLQEAGGRPGRTRSLQVAFVSAVLLGSAYLGIVMPLRGEAPFAMEDGASTYAITAAALLFFGVIGLVATHAGGRWTAPLRARWLGYVGMISYGIYLYHLLVLTVMRAVGPRLGLGSLGIVLVSALGVLAVASLSWRFIERPILSLKDRVHYEGAGGETAGLGEGVEVGEPPPSAVDERGGGLVGPVATSVAG